MNKVKLCNNSYDRTHYQSGNNTIYISFKWIKRITKNEDAFIKTLCFELNREYMHHLLLKQFGMKKCRQLDNMFKEAQIVTFDNYGFNNYLLENQYGGF